MRMKGRTELFFNSMKNIPGTDKWVDLGKPNIFVKVKNTHEGILYEEIAYGGLLFIRNNRRYYGNDMLEVGKMLVLGSYYTGGKVRVYTRT